MFNIYLNNSFRHFIKMSSLLTHNAELLFKKVILLDMNDVPYNHLQRLSSCYGMKLLLIQLLIKGCPSVRRNRHLQTYILRRLIANMPTLWYQCALDFVSTGQCATAIVWLKRAIKSCHLPSRALMTWMLLYCR